MGTGVGVGASVVVVGGRVVVTVVDGLRHDYDDTEMARSRITRTHPFSARPFHPDRPRY